MLRLSIFVLTLLFSGCFSNPVKSLEGTQAGESLYEILIAKYDWEKSSFGSPSTPVSLDIINDEPVIQSGPDAAGPFKQTKLCDVFGIANEIAFIRPSDEVDAIATWSWNVWIKEAASSQKADNTYMFETTFIVSDCYKTQLLLKDRNGKYLGVFDAPLLLATLPESIIFKKHQTTVSEYQNYVAEGLRITNQRVKQRALTEVGFNLKQYIDNFKYLRSNSWAVLGSSCRTGKITNNWSVCDSAIDIIANSDDPSSIEPTFKLIYEKLMRN